MENTNFIKLSECDLGENWADCYLEISKIKKGDTFYECCRGKNIKLKALSDAKRNDYGWTCNVENNEGKIVELFLSANTKYNVIDLLKAPLYLEYDDKFGYIYPIV